MDMLFEPSWGQYITHVTDYAWIGLLAVLVISFIWTCANLGAMTVEAEKLDKAEAEKEAKKKLP